MRIDEKARKKLFCIFYEKAVALTDPLTRNNYLRQRKLWKEYLLGIGCRSMETQERKAPAQGLYVFIPDPQVSFLTWHIQIPRDAALKILVMGLP
jgi:hypothetical protein